MKYRIVKRTYSNGAYYYFVQSKWWIFPWRNDVGYSSNQYWYLDLDDAKKRIESLKVRMLKDTVIE